MKKTLSILFIVLFVGSTAAPLFEFDTCAMPCCALEVETCCQTEKQMDCKMEMTNCDTRILVMLPSAPLNQVNQEIVQVIEVLAPNLFSFIHDNIMHTVLNQALIPEPPPAFNFPLLI
ncbi:MAG: hypothetical protein ISR83_08510 [Candidatus Marinimicrobia bacterium]|nr:hypothetical protein [Candidatus Neomarinimicrobiota bacterium]